MGNLTSSPKPKERVTMMTLMGKTMTIIIAKELAAGAGRESNPGLWIPKEDTLPTVYMTIL